jgi:3-hydroxyisobutyrate dehydrogenase-like beta-hydroxyacid dehydrogenase
MKEGSLLITTSTITSLEIKEIAAAAQAKGINTLDAIVSGGSNGVAAGTLVIMVSGNADVYEECKNTLFAMGSNTVKVGEDIGMDRL